MPSSADSLLYSDPATGLKRLHTKRDHERALLEAEEQEVIEMMNKDPIGGFRRLNRGLMDALWRGTWDESPRLYRRATQALQELARHGHLNDPEITIADWSEGFCSVMLLGTEVAYLEQRQGMELSYFPEGLLRFEDEGSVPIGDLTFDLAYNRLEPDQISKVQVETLARAQARVDTGVDPSWSL